MSEENASLLVDAERLIRSGTVFTSSAEVPFLVLPVDYKLQDTEALQKRPRRIRERLRFGTIESFVAYVQAWADPGSVIFVDEKMRTLRAILDYHASDQSPTWCDHQATFTAQISREATAWMGNNTKGLEQIQFAEFLEERIADVVEPAGADLLERALKLQFIQQAVFGSAVRLQSGEFQLQYSQENQKGSVELPEKVALGLQIFHSGKAYKIDARLRYRLKEGKVTFHYKLVELEKAMEHAFDEITREISAALPEVTLYTAARGQE
jgi:uncharacterized protein YfdQ (DUF2303 family)